MSQMSCSTTSDSSTIPLLCEQRLDLHFAEIKQKLDDLIYKEQVNQLWKLGVESTLHSIWNKLCYQHACVSTASQTDELLREDCDTSPESAIHLDKTSRALQEAEHELDIDVELHNAVAVVPSSSSSARGNEMSASFPSSEQHVMHSKANGGNLAEYNRFCSEQQKENVCFNEVSRAVQQDNSSTTEQDNSFASDAEEENECNGEEQQDVVEVIPSSSSSAHDNEMSVSDASPEQGTKRNKRSNPAKFYQCRYCESKFSRKVEMFHHQRSHGKPPFKCDNCSQVFTNRSSFTKHPPYCSYRPNEDGSFDCAECGKTCSTRKKFTNHLLCHAERKHECPLCGQAFKWPSHLKGHMVTHTGATPFRCKFCPRSFATASSRRYHILMDHAKEQENTDVNPS